MEVYELIQELTRYPAKTEVNFVGHTYIFCDRYHEKAVPKEVINFYVDRLSAAGDKVVIKLVEV